MKKTTITKEYVEQYFKELDKCFEKVFIEQKPNILITKISTFQKNVEYRILDITDRQNPITLTKPFSSIAYCTSNNTILLPTQYKENVRLRMIRSRLDGSFYYYPNKINLCNTNKRKYCLDNMIVYIIPFKTYTNHYKVVGVTETEAFDLFRFWDKKNIVHNDKIIGYSVNKLFSVLRTNLQIPPTNVVFIGR